MNPAFRFDSAGKASSRYGERWALAHRLSQGRPASTKGTGGLTPTVRRSETVELLQ